MTELDKFFITDEKENCVRFVGDKLEALIPKRYASKNFLVVEKIIKALGVFTLRVNDTLEGGLQLPGVIQMEPIETYETTIGGDEYFVAVFHKGNRFMTTLDVFQDEKIGYFMWTEFLSVGRMPLFINYNNIPTLFDDLKEITGKGIEVDHAVVEIIYAHLYRDKDNLNTFYRHTDMKKEPARVSLRNVAYGPSSTHSRIIGSYADDGRNAALLNQSEVNHQLEDLFRA